MKVIQVEISNILGIRHLKFNAGKFNVAAGDNGVGKTTILSAIEAAVGGGNRAELLRNGTDKGEIVLILDTGHKLRTSISANGTKRTIETSEGAEIKKPAAWIEQRLNPSSFRPVEFVEGDNESRRKLLTKASKLELAPEAFVAALGSGRRMYESVVGDDASKMDMSEPLEKIAAVVKVFYDQRTGVNRSAKDKRSHCAELDRTLPLNLDSPPDVKALNSELAAVRKEASTERARIQQEEATARTAIDRSATDAKKAAQAKFDADFTALRAEFDRKVAALSEQKETDMAQIAELQKTELLRALDGSKAALDALQQRLGPQAESLQKQIGEAQTILDAHNKAEGTRAAIDKARTEAEKLEKESKELTAALERLEALKGQVLKGMPVEGLEIRPDGQIAFNGILFETLNTAEQIDVAMQIAEATAGELGLIQLDGFERLGAKKRKVFEERCLKSRCQMFVARVVDGEELTVKTIDPETVVAA